MQVYYIYHIYVTGFDLMSIAIMVLESDIYSPIKWIKWGSLSDFVWVNKLVNSTIVEICMPHKEDTFIGLEDHYQLNTLRPRQNGRHFSDDIFKCNLLNENAWIAIKISLKFVPKGPINNIPALVQIMAFAPLSRRQVIISTSDGIVYWRKYASLVLNELVNR